MSTKKQASRAKTAGQHEHLFSPDQRKLQDQKNIEIRREHPTQKDMVDN